MHIAIDARPLTGPNTGDRTYWRSLVRALAAAAPDSVFTLYSRIPIPAADVPPHANVRLRCIAASSDRIWAAITLPRAVQRDGADLLHVQYTIPPHWLTPCPTITTVHDISFRLYPEWFPFRHRVLMNLTVPPSMRAAARVITDSESSKTDILRSYGLPPEEVVAIPLGVPEDFIASGAPSNDAERAADRAVIREKYGIDVPFVLAVGVLQPRKNLRMLAEAFGVAKAKCSLPHKLVLVGKAGWQTERETLSRLAMDAGGPADALHFTGYIPDSDLPLFYRACDAFAHPALYEGFGIPPIEAMTCGAPVVVSDGPALPEVVGDGALVVAARDVKAWGDALCRIVTDQLLRERLRGLGAARAAEFRWEKTAIQTLDVYRSVIEVKRNGAAGART